MSDEQDVVQVDLLYPGDVQGADLDDLPDSYLEELWQGTKQWLFQKGVLRSSETGFKAQVPENAEQLQYENEYRWNRTGGERVIDDGEVHVDELEALELDDGDYVVFGVDVKKNGVNRITVEALNADGASLGEDGYTMRLDERGYR